MKPAIPEPTCGKRLDLNKSHYCPLANKGEHEPAHTSADSVSGASAGYANEETHRAEKQRCKGAPAWLAPYDYDKQGEYDRTVRGRLCRKLRTSRWLNQCVVQYEDGTTEVVTMGLLRRVEKPSSGDSNSHTEKADSRAL